MARPSTRTVDVSAGTIHYDDVGSGPTLVFVHGVFTNAGLWNSVIPALTTQFRCIVPTLPLGAHSSPMHPDADLSPGGLSRLIAELLDRLELHDVTLIGNDTGGALCQLVAAHYPQRIAKLVLTNCDAFEDFPPRVLRPLYAATRIPGFVWVFAQALRLRFLQRLFFATVAQSDPNAAFLKSSFEPFITQSRVRRDLRKTIRSISPRDTIAAARTFESFHRPVLIVWGTADLFFPTKLAHRLARAFPQSRVELVPGSRTFLPQDNPAALTASLQRFIASPALA